MKLREASNEYCISAAIKSVLLSGRTVICLVPTRYIIFFPIEIICAMKNYLLEEGKWPSELSFLFSLSPLQGDGGGGGRQ